MINLKNFIFIIYLLLFTISCSLIEKTEENVSVTEANYVGKVYEFSDFNKIDVAGAFDVVVSQSPHHEIRIDASQKILSKIIVKQDGQSIEIRQKGSSVLKNKGAIKVYVSAPEWIVFEGSGAVDYQSEGNITSLEEVEIDLSGSSSIYMKIDAPKLKVELQGASQANLSGKVQVLEVEGSGSCTIDAATLVAEIVELDLTGASYADVYAQRSLKLDMSGATKLIYQGDATIIEQKVSGAATINKR